MFEQASIESPGLLKRPWAMSISIIGQAAVLSAVVLVSLWQTGSLPRVSMVTGLVPPSASPVHHEPPKAASRFQTTKMAAHAFTAPAVVPKHISQVVDLAPDTPPEGEAGVTGVLGGIDGLSAVGHPLIIGQPRPTVPPPQQTKPAVKESLAPPPSKPVAVSKGVQEAKLRRQIMPAYPPLARQARIAGTVRLAAIIGRDGAIQNLRVLSGHPLLVPAAVEAVKQWLYQPTLLNEVAVDVITEIDVNFTLSQ